MAELRNIWGMLSPEWQLALGEGAAIAIVLIAFGVVILDVVLEFKGICEQEKLSYIEQHSLTQRRYEKQKQEKRRKVLRRFRRKCYRVLKVFAVPMVVLSFLVITLCLGLYDALVNAVKYACRCSKKFLS